ncbi:MAG: DNA translocase FtsK 4TM domain-containing protein [Opitutaceae bacterium]|nr:DNA translocase FtsK 4TM domain-containing protein [Opitutaceae bacterium]
MRKSETSNSKNVPSFEGPRYRPKWLAASICFLLGSWIGVTLLDYDPRQSHEYQIGGQSAWEGGKWVIHNLAAPPPNLGGGWGADIAWWTLHLMGLSTWLVPVFLLWFAWVAVRNARRLVVTRFVAMILCVITESGLLAMLESFKNSEYFTCGLGGLVGQQLYGQLLKETVGVVGAGLLLGTVFALTLAFIFTRDIGTELERMLASVQAWRTRRRQRAAERAEQKKKDKEAVAKAVTAKQAAVALAPPTPAKKTLIIPKTKEEITREAATAKIIGSTPAESVKSAFTAPLPSTAAGEPASAKMAVGKLNIVKPEETKKAKSTLLARSDENYEFPPLSLLREPAKLDVTSSEEEHRQNAENLLRILGEFGVEVTLGEIHVGPVITRYEVIPAAGVRVEKIAGLDKNIALGMRAQSVRIMAPIPGKAAVGVEVPNQKRMEVGLREIIESEDWAGAKADLPIALGKDVSGRPLVSDLAKMPHLLIAGATGSGKSVCINALISSILYHASPRDVRLLMIDPKIVELKIFNDLPHMLIPVVTEAKKVPAALKWLLREMEMRYQIFAKVGVRNISSFNNRKKPAKEAAPPAETQTTLDVAAPPGDIEVPDHLHYIIAIIDELADLMMVSPAEIETSVARLAQLARATGIHIIIATQRPSVNVITGIIKANLPSRIAFQVASQVDSRTIIDTKGAETLIGRGDMLFSPPGSSKLVRAQGALVSDEEINKLIEFLKRNGPPAYAQDVQAHIDRAASEDDEGEGEGGDEDEMGDDEELFKQAVEVLKTSRRASTSMLQRRLRIGYNRAARIMELMEEKGLVGPENGAQPRDILVDLDKL